MVNIDLFAVAIVERLLHHGADITVENCGRMAACFPEPGIGRRPEQPDQWQRGMTDGALRELHALVGLVPGARDAVRAYVRAFPGRVYLDGVTA